MKIFIFERRQNAISITPLSLLAADFLIGIVALVEGDVV